MISLQHSPKHLTATIQIKEAVARCDLLRERARARAQRQSEAQSDTERHTFTSTTRVIAESIRQIVTFENDVQQKQSFLKIINVENGSILGYYNYNDRSMIPPFLHAFCGR